MSDLHDCQPETCGGTSLDPCEGHVWDDSIGCCRACYQAAANAWTDKGPTVPDAVIPSVPDVTS